jgi:hypothetical protein
MVVFDVILKFLLVVIFDVLGIKSILKQVADGALLHVVTVVLE